MGIKFFYKENCTLCDAVKISLDGSGLDYEEFNADNPAVKKGLGMLRIHDLPYLLAVNDFGSEYKALGLGINIKSLKEFMTGRSPNVKISDVKELLNGDTGYDQ